MEGLLGLCLMGCLIFFYSEVSPSRTCLPSLAKDASVAWDDRILNRAATVYSTPPTVRVLQFSLSLACHDTAGTFQDVMSSVGAVQPSKGKTNDTTRLLYN